MWVQKFRERLSDLSYQSRKNCFFVMNFIFFGTGLASLIAGVWLYLEKNDFIELTPSFFSALSAAGLCVFSGATICIISVVGLIASSIHSKCLLKAYIAFIFLLMFSHFFCGFTGFFYKESTRERIRHDLLGNINRSIAMTQSGRAIKLSVSWDHLQETLGCCGVDGPSDWYRTIQWPKNDFVPDSCCDPDQFAASKSMSGCGKIHKNNLLFNRGCYPIFADWLFHHVHIVTLLSIMLIMTEVFIQFFAFLVLVGPDPPPKDEEDDIFGHRFGSFKRRERDADGNSLYTIDDAEYDYPVQEPPYKPSDVAGDPKDQHYILPYNHRPKLNRRQMIVEEEEYDYEKDALRDRSRSATSDSSKTLTS